MYCIEENCRKSIADIYHMHFHSRAVTDVRIL